MNGWTKLILAAGILLGGGQRASAVVVSDERVAITFQKEKVPSGVTWSSFFTLTDKGLVSAPGKGATPNGIWIQTQKIPVGLAWRPPKACNIRLILIRANEKPEAGIKAWVRYGCDGEHWSTWYKLRESGPDQNKRTTYSYDLQLPLAAQAKYDILKEEWRKANSRSFADDDTVCAWIARQYPEFFDREIPLIGYVQFRLESLILPPGVAISGLEIDTFWTVAGAGGGSMDANRKWSLELPKKRQNRTSQNPSPMVEHARAHPRLNEEKPAGRHEKLTLGTLFLPDQLRREGQVPLFVHFHGGTWLPEVAAARYGRAAVLAVQLGSGSGVYARAFADPKTFGRLLREAEAKAGVRFGPVGLTAWSAGYGAVREILKVPENYQRVRFVLLIDGLHASYVGGRPGPRESQLVAEDLEPFVRFARDAAAGKKQMIVTHSEIFPGTYASTTETTDYLLRQLGARRQATLRWGPMQTQQLSEARQGKLRVVGYAGNTAPDHVDQLHSLPEYLTWIDWGNGEKGSK